jgi:excisionase family DNA binding protein
MTEEQGGATMGDANGTRAPAPESPDSPDDLLTLDEVAALLRVPRSWIYERIRRKLIPHVKLGKYLRFPRRALLRWVEGPDAVAAGAPDTDRVISDAARPRGRPLRLPARRSSATGTAPHNA